MDVKTVCLGMLSDGEASGYDLKKHFESTFAHFFAAGYGSIYPALASLLADGLVECNEVLQDGKPDRKVYRITADGHAYLRSALDHSVLSHKVRSEFLAAMCFAHLMSPEQIAAILDHRVADLERYLEMFDEFDQCNDGWPAGKQFVCGFGRAITEASRNFIEANRHRLFTAHEEKQTAAG